MARTVAHMDEMTQQNAMMADASSRLSRELQGETQALAALVGAFRLGGRDASDAPERLAAGLRAMLPAAKPAPVPAGRPPVRTAVRVGSGGADGWAEF
jgi:methyl-accepting chemotaxis protein